jgi:hypothetical protein
MFSTTDPYVKQVAAGPFNGAPLFIESIAQNGPIGQPEVTVDVTSTFIINQNDAQVQVYIYWPTDSETTRFFLIANTGSEDFNLTDEESLFITVASKTATMIVYIPGRGYVQLIANPGT